jgi:hypothetical protein
MANPTADASNIDVSTNGNTDFFMLEIREIPRSRNQSSEGKAT